MERLLEECLEQYKSDLVEIDTFVKTLDPAVRSEAFKFLLEKTLKHDRAAAGLNTLSEQSLMEGADRILGKISVDSGIPVERLIEVYEVNDSEVHVIDSSLPNTGPADLAKKITLLCAYGNTVGKGIAKVEISTIYKNLRELKAATTAYARDVKSAEGVKIVAGKTATAMLVPDGREKARLLLKQILKL